MGKNSEKKCRLVFMPFWGIQNTLNFSISLDHHYRREGGRGWVLKLPKNVSSNFFTNSGNLEHFLLFPFPTKCFGPPQWRGGSKWGGGGGEIKGRRVDNLKFLGCYESLVY